MFVASDLNESITHGSLKAKNSTFARIAAESFPEGKVTSDSKTDLDNNVPT